ncbi:TPA: hypothetical protein ACNVQT_004317 [Citrobacter farmeri]
MHRIDTVTAQKDKFGAGKNGFTRGNPQTGTPATDLDDDYFDMLQEELCAVVEESGEELDKEKHNQLLTALRALLLSRSNPFGDIASDGPDAIATALANLGLGDAAKLGVAKNSDMQTSPGSAELLTTVAAVMSVLPTRAMSPTDYVRIPDKPGGLIIQWGTTPIIPKASWVDVTFPIPFPSSFLSLMAIFKEANSGCIEYRPYSGASLLTGCQIGEGGAAHYSGSNRAIYIAIGQ